MTVNDVEKQVLRLLDEVGVSDYNQRMNKLIDTAQRDIACTWGFILRSCTLDVEAGVAVPLPENLYAIERADNEDFDLEPLEVDGKWQMGIVFSKSGTVKVIYKAYPDEIGDNDNSKEIQLAPEYHSALCCYVAALTQQAEWNKQNYQVFMDRYDEIILQVQNARRMSGKARVVTDGQII